MPSSDKILKITIIVNRVAKVGVSLEMTNASWRVGLVYTVGVLAGSLANSVVDPVTHLAGASGEP